MFDKHEPFHKIEKQDFSFLPNRYEIWIGGKMIKNGKTNKPLIAKTTTENGYEKVVINMQDEDLKNEIAVNNTFDEFVSGADRLQLITIPSETNVSCVGIQAMQMTIGATRDFKAFNGNEPYCCNLFTIDGRIAKITFSFSNPEKLIEFYADEKSDTDNGKEIINKAFELLSKSKDSLLSKHSHISVSDIEADVINVACKFIIENFRNEIASNHNINEMHPQVQQNMKFQPLAQIFTGIAKEIYPNKYTVREEQAGQLAIIQNISWGGMWDFLRDYFEKKHNAQIDNVKSETTTFYSSRHERFQNNEMVSASDVERIVMLNFSENKNEVIVSIEPTLSAKKARLINDNQNELKYQGYDEDYVFHISLSFFDEVDKFTLEMPKRNLKIIYNE